ncbi:MAG: 50S ribosomal protein L17 [Erysipelotrichaceae bacterium]|jgi:large subunit ribosomal protein L17|nr:50S ribosomal protein L17 [Erysipelotrichaceae bacterium]
MKTQGRKNVHGKGGVRSKAAYTTSKYKSMLRTLVTDLIVKGSVTVTLSTARDLVSLADKMVTYGKKGDLNSRRLAAAVIRDVWADEANRVTALKKLFDEIAPSYKDRNGGYTRVLKIANRRGDNAPMAIVSLVK